MSNEGFVKKWQPAFLVEESGCVRYNNVVGHEISSFWNNLDLASIVGSDLDNDVFKASVV